MKRNDFLFILVSFLIWRIGLFIFLYAAFKFLPLQQNFLGGGMQNYLAAPWLWSWLNFDGEHYLAIAQSGYQPLTYFFFPIFPLAAKAVGNLIGGGFGNLALGGLMVANLSFLAALTGLWKIAEMEFNKKVAKYTLLLLLFFPTSYYFGSYYTESLFLALTVWSFYFIRRNKWLSGGILAAVATATRIVGVALLPAYFVEFIQDKKRNFWQFASLGLAPLGILIYMYYLKVKTGDPLNFLNTVSIFGAQRSTTLILLPQVFYRYFFKILPALNLTSWPTVYTTGLELAVALLFLVLGVAAFWKLRLSLALYLALGYLIPTLSGSFSSLPRYVLILFSGYILMAVYFAKLSKVWKISLLGVLLIGLGITTMLFVRGYWVA